MVITREYINGYRLIWKTSSDMAQVFVLGPVLFNCWSVTWISLMTHSICEECKMQRTPQRMDDRISISLSFKVYSFGPERPTVWGVSSTSCLKYYWNLVDRIKSVWVTSMIQLQHFLDYTNESASQREFLILCLSQHMWNLVFSSGCWFWGLESWKYDQELERM